MNKKKKRVYIAGLFWNILKDFFDQRFLIPKFYDMDDKKKVLLLKKGEQSEI